MGPADPGSRSECMSPRTAPGLARSPIWSLPGVHRVRPPRVLRVLARIITDLDELTGYPSTAAEGRTEGKSAEARRACHRRWLAEPDQPPKRMTVQEERASLWDALGRPPTSERGDPAVQWIRISPSRDGLENVRDTAGEFGRPALDRDSCLPRRPYPAQAPA
jgi:hypothetical protein